ncbi:MAG: oxidoreductase [Gemmatimonadetes bacterium]|nr:oxidoreductase [Gemmatimonadota bacterium]
MGLAIAELGVRAGYEVAISGRRAPSELRDIAASIGTATIASHPADAAAFGHIVVIAIPWCHREALAAYADVLRERVIVDTMNPFLEDRSLDAIHATHSSYVLARALGASRVVKAFNTIWYKELREHSTLHLPLERRRAIFLAADCERSKGTVARLVCDMGYAPVDSGGLLSGGGRQAPGGEFFGLHVDGARATRASGATLWRPAAV